MGELLSAWEIAEDRTMVLGELDDTCRITRASGVRGPMDPVTGQYPAAVRVTIYEGPCRFQIKPDMNANIIEPITLEREWAYTTSTLQVPMAGTDEIQVDDMAECLTSPHDPSMVGRLYNIQSGYHKTHASHRRLRVREAVG